MINFLTALLDYLDSMSRCSDGGQGAGTNDSSSRDFLEVHAGATNSSQERVCCHEVEDANDAVFSTPRPAIRRVSSPKVGGRRLDDVGSDHRRSGTQVGSSRTRTRHSPGCLSTARARLFRDDADALPGPPSAEEHARSSPAPSSRPSLPEEGWVADAVMLARSSELLFLVGGALYGRDLQLGLMRATLTLLTRLCEHPFARAELSRASLLQKAVEPASSPLKSGRRTYGRLLGDALH